MTEGGGAGASTPNKDLTVSFLAFWRLPPPDPRDEPTNKQNKKIATESGAVGFGSASLKSSLFSGCGTFGADVMSGPSRGQCVAVQGPE